MLSVFLPLSLSVSFLFFFFFFFFSSFMQNSPMSPSLSLSLSLLVSFTPPQGQLRVAEQQSDRAVSLSSLSLQVNKSPSESRATYTATYITTQRKHLREFVWCFFFFFFHSPLFFSPAPLCSCSLTREEGGGFALQPRWMENKLMIKAWPLSGLCHFAAGTMLRGRKGEKCQGKNRRCSLRCK